MHRVRPGASHVSRPAGLAASSASLGITVLIMNLKYHSLIPFHSYVLPRRALTGVGTFYNMALLTKMYFASWKNKANPPNRDSKNMLQNELESKKSTPICLWKNDRRRRCLSPLLQGVVHKLRWQDFDFLGLNTPSSALTVCLRTYGIWCYLCMLHKFHCVRWLLTLDCYV